MAYAFPSQTNTFVRTFDVTGKLVVNFSRNPKDFLVNKLAKITPTDKTAGFYAKLNPDTAARIVNAKGHVWHDGQPRPVTPGDQAEFDYKPFQQTRYAYQAPIGYMASDQADLPLIEVMSQQQAARAMTFRATKLYEVAYNTANYDSTHVATATALGGGKWDVATNTAPYIQKTLQAVARQIEKDTIGAVKYDDLTLVISPTIAQAIAQSQEYRDTLKQSPFADGMLTGQGNINRAYGIGELLYGMKVVVDPTIRVSTKTGAASTTRGYVSSDTTALVIARPGDLVNVGVAASDFSSFHFFTYSKDEMNVEVIDYPIDRRRLVTVTDTFECQLVAPEATFAITATNG